MKIIDNFLPQGEFLEEITNDARWKNPLPYSWFEGNQTKNIWEDLAFYVWNYVNKPNIEYAGFEYWANPLSLTGQKNLDWHYDKDEHIWETEGKVVTPAMGMVYYAHKQLPTGGYLEIQHDNEEIERIQPVPNRLIIFDPSIVHRVTDITAGVRRTFASNVWVNKPSKENFV